MKSFDWDEYTACYSGTKERFLIHRKPKNDI